MAKRTNIDELESTYLNAIFKWRLTEDDRDFIWALESATSLRSQEELDELAQRVWPYWEPSIFWDSANSRLVLSDDMLALLGMEPGAESEEWLHSERKRLDSYRLATFDTAGMMIDTYPTHARTCTFTLTDGSTHMLMMLYDQFALSYACSMLFFNEKTGISSKTEKELRTFLPDISGMAR